MATKQPEIKLKQKPHKAYYDTRELDQADRDAGRHMIEKKESAMSTYFGNDQVQAIAFRVSDMYAKGFNDQEVLDFIKIEFGYEWTTQKLALLKKMLHAFWRSQTAELMEDQIAQEVNACNVQIRELWKAYEFSKRGVQRETTRKTSSVGGEENTYDQDETITVKETTAGDTKIMSQIIEVSKEKRKLLGLYAPEKKDMGKGGGGGTNIQIAIVDNNGEQTGGILGSILSAAGRKNADENENENENENVSEAEVVQEAEAAERELEEAPERKEKDMNFDELFEELS